jgi:hypothetical protein
MAVPGFMTVRFARPWYSPDHVLYGRKERIQQVPEAFEELLPSGAVVVDGGTGKHKERVERDRQARGLRPLDPQAMERLADLDTSPRDHAMLDEQGNVVVQKPAPNPPAEPGNFTKQPTPMETIEANEKPSNSTEKQAAERVDSMKKK